MLTLADLDDDWLDPPEAGPRWIEPCHGPHYIVIYSQLPIDPDLSDDIETDYEIESATGRPCNGDTCHMGSILDRGRGELFDAMSFPLHELPVGRHEIVAGVHEYPSGPWSLPEWDEYVDLVEAPC